MRFLEEDLERPRDKTNNSKKMIKKEYLMMKRRKNLLHKK